MNSPNRLPKSLRRRVAEQLRAAAELLVTDGWTQGQFTDEQGRHCIADALAQVFPDDDDDDGDFAWGEARRALYKFTGSWNLTSWNDEPERTAEEVIAALRDTAAELDPTD